jgi:hypothetical protein
MAEADWTELTGGLTANVARGVTAGYASPNGSGLHVFGFHSLEIVDGAVAYCANQTNFVPMAKGGSIRGALCRALSGGPTGFAPFLYLGLQSGAVSASGYLLGLGDGDPHHIVLRKGAILGGLPDLAADPDGTDHILMRSTETFEVGTWHHLRLDMIVQGSGDVLLQVFRSNLDSHTVESPSWGVITGMEGPQYPTIDGFVDDALGVNTGSSPFTSGRGGFAFRVEDVSRRAYFDYLELSRQV